MEKILEKLKKSRVSTIIIGIVSFTWIIVDYFVIMKLYNNNSIDFGIDIFLLGISAISIISFHIMVVIFLYNTYRLTHKLKQSEKQSAAKDEASPNLETSKNMENQ